MKSLDERIQQYDEYHATPFTRLTHACAVPGLYLAVFIFFSWLRIDFATHIQVDVAWLIAFVLFVYYIRLNWWLGLMMGVLLSLLCWLADWIAGPKPDVINSIIFIVLLVSSASLIQIGHNHEKRHACSQKKFYHCSIALLMQMANFLGHLGVRHFRRK